MMEVLPKDPRSHEPWWNEGCEDLYRQECEARLRFEKNPSLEASKAFRRLQKQFRKAVISAERNYAYKMQMAPGKFGTDFPHTEENWKKELKKTKEKKKKKKSNKDDGTESDADNLDLNQEMFSLTHYVSDQEELVNQMFSIIKGPKLEAMLPPILRSIPLHELKNLCLHELRGMSKKRILCAINGQEMEGSSESEEDEEERKENVGANNNNKDESPLKKSVPDTAINTDNTDSNKGIPAFLLKTIKVEDQDADSSRTKSSSGGKSVLELLELQMRARIIKTMLEKGDDGKTLTEDAIVALMGTPTQSSDVAKSVIAVKAEKDTEATEDPDGKDHSKGDKEVDKKRSNEEKRHRDDTIKRGRSGHKKEHHRRKGAKRQRSTELKDSEEETEKRSRRDRSSDKRHKKKKITRKEFEERMKRAKKNRSYRQRKSSEEEEKINAVKTSESYKDEQLDDKNKGGEDLPNEGKKEDGKIVTEKDGEAVSEREEGEAVSEKEEGELDSDEEEEGACSPSDITSGSYYSSSRSYTSRSRSRSYSRSWSRSPVRRRGRGRSRSRSWTRSRSRSRSPDRRKRDGGRSTRRSRKDNHSSGSLKMSSGIVSLPSNNNNKQQKEEEDNWGQSCDIEFVDSEEDFDDNSGDRTRTAPVDTKKPLPMKGQSYERASISFSLQKKTVPSITPNVDLDDLPLKSSSLGIGKEIKILEVETAPRKELKEPEEIINLDSPKMPSDEILISSDSEQEGNNIVKTKSVRVEKRDQIHGVKVTRSSARQALISYDGSAHADKPDADQSNGNQASKNSSQEQDLQGGKKITDKLILHNCFSSDQGTKLDADILQQTCEGITENTQGITSESREDGEKEIFVSKEEKALEEKQNENKDIQSVNASEEVRKEEKDYTNGSPVNEDRDSPVASTVSASDENRHNFCPLDSDEVTETIFPKNDDSSTVMPKSLLGLEVKVNIVGKEKDDICMNSTNEPMEKDVVQPCVISCEGASTSRVENIKECSGKSAVREGETADIKAIPKPHEIRTQKVILEHLQDSYNEEQDNNQESGSEDQKIPSSRPEEEKVTIDFNDIKSPVEKDNHEEPSDKVIEVNKEYQDKEDKGRQDTEKGEHLNEHKGTEQTLDDDNYNEDKGTEHGSNDDSNINKPPVDDFFRGADELTFSDDDTEGCKIEDLDASGNKEIEPIRINTGLIRKQITRAKKVEMEAPGKSWTKKEKKKKEKPKDVLAMEGIGLLKQTLRESVQSPSPKEEEKEPCMNQKEANEPTNDDDTCTSWGVSSVSSKEETSVDSRVQSPKENSVQTSPSENSENNVMLDTHPGQTKNNQDTEIIGVIKASSSSDVNQMDDIDVGGSSWSMRWLQSEKVQKVVSSSKMLSRVRKKIQKKDKATKVVPCEKPVIPVKKIPDPVVPVIGSIEEYERLFGMKVKKSNDESAEVLEGSTKATSSSEKVPDEPSKDNNQQPVRRTTFGSDDEGEDSEEEALWSKILGK